MSDNDIPPSPLPTPPVVPGVSLVKSKCRKPDCKSIDARQIQLPGDMPGRFVYQCVTCGFTWGAVTGGFINL